MRRPGSERGACNRTDSTHVRGSKSQMHILDVLLAPMRHLLSEQLVKNVKPKQNKTKKPKLNK